LAGALGAIAARALRLPAACGALAGGAVLLSSARQLGWIEAWPDLGLIRSLGAAFLCFLLGAQIDLTRLVRRWRPIVGSALTQSGAVMLLVGVVGWAIGLGWIGRVLLASGAVAASPTGLIAVASESRARGDLTQAILTISLIGLVVGSLAAAVVNASALLWLGIAGGGLALGAACGAVIMMPLSRMSTRGAIVTCVLFGSILLWGCTRLLAAPWMLAPMSILAGFMSGNLIPNRDLIRDALNDAAVPASVILFALVGSSVLIEEIPGVLMPAALLLVARGAAIFIAEIMTGSSSPRALRPAALLPMAGCSVTTAAVMAAASATASASASTTVTAGLVGAAEGYPLAATLFTAALMSEAFGMIGTRWALHRGGEAAPASENPDAWRAQMR
ncbi:MAG TPA: cation:proton antiporter, partial [Ktedonobacterales bacterium]|nr:cation:proton antiporter [Ktedonobacterales bacterium]